jgi:hypothetical protein
VSRDVLEWPFTPSVPEDIQGFCRELSNRQTKNILFLFGCVDWALWLIRNEFVFQGTLVSSPSVGLYRSMSFLQKWKILNKEKWKILNKETKQQWIDLVTQRLKRQLSSLA